LFDIDCLSAIMVGNRILRPRFEAVSQSYGETDVVFGLKNEIIIIYNAFYPSLSLMVVWIGNK
jgi:hypothetical protein